MSTGERTYSSARRAEQAAATHRRIADAARRLFIARGFAATTVEAIARKAGVAVPTVYATYGSKRAILIQLLDDLEARAGRDELVKALSATDDPRAQLRLIVSFEVRLFSDGAELIAAVRGAGAHDREFDALRIEGEARRRRAQGALVRGWAERGALRAGIPEDEAADVMWGMSSDVLYTQFVRGNGWTTARYERWICETLESLILAPPDPR